MAHMGEKMPDGLRSADASAEIMAAHDDSGGVRELIIADITTDDAWLSILASEAPVLARWR